jgi:WD40 repeat protein
MTTIKAYLLPLSIITIISPLLLATQNPPSLRDLTANTFIKTVANCSLQECLSQVEPNKVPGDVIELLRKALIQRYRVLLLNITNSCPSTVLLGYNNGRRLAAFSPDGKYVLTKSDNHTACIWIRDKDNIQSYVLNGHTNIVRSVALSRDAKFALTGSYDNTVRLWDMQDKDNIQSYILNGYNGIISVAYSPDGKLALTGSFDNTARLWDIQDKDNIQPYVLNCHTHYVSSVAFSPDGKFALTGSADSTARLWDIQDINTIQSYVLNGHHSMVRSVAFSPDSKFALTGSYDGAARLWNLVEPLISMESLTLPMILLIIKLHQNAQYNNHILSQKHYSQIFNASSDQQLKEAIITYFQLEPITASSSNSN